MTRLLRQLDSFSSWIKLADDEAVASAIKDPPLWAIKEFIPSERDDGNLSVFAAEGDEEIRELAGAIGLQNGNQGVGRIVFAVAELDDVLAKSFKPQPTLGNYKHRNVDLRHREVAVKSVTDLLDLVRLFLPNDLIFIEKKIIELAARASASKNHFNFPRLLKSKGTDIPQVRHLCNYIVDGVVLVRGSAEFPG